VFDVILMFDEEAKAYNARVAGIPRINVTAGRRRDAIARARDAITLELASQEPPIRASPVRAEIISVSIDEKRIKAARIRYLRKRRAAAHALIKGIEAPEPRNSRFRLR
jgi:hypothetical protein